MSATRTRIAVIGGDQDAPLHAALRVHPRFALVTDREEAEALAILLPPSERAFAIHEALGCGTHVLCEAPLAENLDAASAVVSAPNASLACGTFFPYRFTAQAQALKQLVVNAHLDPIAELEVTSLTGTGTIEDARWHAIDAALWLAGSNDCTVAGFARPAGDGIFAVVKFDRGIFARLAIDGATKIAAYTCAVHGANRTAVASGPDAANLTLFTVDENDSDELDCKPSPYAKFASVGALVPLSMELLEEFAKAIGGKHDTALPTFGDALAAQRVLLSLR